MLNRKHSALQRKGSFTALITSIIFLAVSIVTSVFIARQINPPLFLEDSASVTLGSVSSPSSIGRIETNIPPTVRATGTLPPPDETPLPAADITLGFVQLAGDTPHVTEALQTALEESLSQSSLTPSHMLIQLDLPVDSFKSSLEVAAVQEIDIVLAWEPGPGSLTRIYITSPPQPPLGVIGSRPEAWNLAVPANLALYAEISTEGSFLAEITVAILEINHGLVDAALARVRALRPEEMALPSAAMAHNEAATDFLVARAEAARGNVTGALQSYSRALRNHGEFAAAHLNRANLYLALGDLTSARTGYQRAAELASGSPIPLYNEILTSWSDGDFDTALDGALSLVSQEPDTAWAMNLLGLIYFEQTQ